MPGVPKPLPGPGSRRPTTIALAARGTPRRSIDRNADRRITILGLAIAATFLVAAAASVLVPNLRGQWLPLHLVLAGAATVAIGAVMPFFAAALVAGPPASAPIRLAIVGLLAIGAAGVTIGFGTVSTGLAVGGGLAFVVGLVLLLALTVSVLTGSAGANRRIFAAVYGIAVINVIVGASIATAYVAGERDVLANWSSLKSAHAWLNLFGFVGLVISATLLHLYPTVVGARMDASRWGAAALVGLTAGPPLVALGFILRADPVALAGAAAMVGGTVALLAVLGRIWRSRSRWTSDAEWHVFAISSLSAGIAWFAVAVATAVGRLVVDGTRPAGWSITELIAPVGVGFVVQIVIGAWTHLLPAIGPGSPGAHARARQRLASAALPRVAGINVGAALLFAGALASNPDVARAGLAVAGVSVVVSLALFALTALETLREPEPVARPTP